MVLLHSREFLFFQYADFNLILCLETADADLCLKRLACLGEKRDVKTIGRG